ncbi:histidine phosphotransferase family protein [Phaeobacter gallaeciensis]|uniref:histidine phosphotransferase family protein n=1 Tax=Phaeobacter gallaeciensis TaxID=60890 RepID=UPI00237F9FF8|nr:histidine phosphotransferase family protein [Phaeobacter gallaeciensis]MDE4096499.1 histidine phosphotransferase family protein [Phaeobacter gallaeciensis]MDE4105310.1 histidine phosphotransferase family protein [Phaeobacter gallaeciensis]MDE4109766.1 histidine phosphotransferase family protein [Phaeobacter gallaeciensis]MDE4114234.1 histidine phosphotransferase family protein [Phaeobacter gallaeciensis]MDE4118701.1 histidine phosphotransferase family protein [Phaeobacter gallaeciensis]
MAVDNEDLPALIGSRICHDLISPIGAINNGLELLGMSGEVSGPEMELISDSVTNANARIRFFRIAFGAAGDQQIGRAEVVSVLDDVSKGGRLSYQWAPLEGSSRSEVRMAFLAALCLESALPYGGTITVLCADGHWTVIGEGPKLNVDDALWARLGDDAADVQVTPAQVQFAMLPYAAKQAERDLKVEQALEKISIFF